MSKVLKVVSASMSKSLPTGPVRGLRGPAPKYSVAQVEAGASAALAHGAIDARVATAISASLAMGGVAAIPSNIMAILEGR